MFSCYLFKGQTVDLYIRQRWPKVYYWGSKFSPSFLRNRQAAALNRVIRYMEVHLRRIVRVVRDREKKCKRPLCYWILRHCISVLPGRTSPIVIVVYHPTVCHAPGEISLLLVVSGIPEIRTLMEWNILKSPINTQSIAVSDWQRMIYIHFWRQNRSQFRLLDATSLEIHVFDCIGII